MQLVWVFLLNFTSYWPTSFSMHNAHIECKWSFVKHPVNYGLLDSVRVRVLVKYQNLTSHNIHFIEFHLNDASDFGLFTNEAGMVQMRTVCYALTWKARKYPIDDSIASRQERNSILKIKEGKTRRRRSGRCEGKEAVSIFQWSEQANEVWCQQLSIYIHNGLDNVVVAFEEISISHRIFFLFIYIFTEQRPHSWELCENSWIFPLEFEIFQNFRLFCSLALFVFNKAARHHRIDVTQTI